MRSSTRSHSAWRPASQRSGYRSVRPIAAADVDAIMAFVVVRHSWLVGEYAGRLDVWGTQALPTPWLREQPALLTAWADLATPQ